MPSENGHSSPKHVKAVNIYKLSLTGHDQQLFYNIVLKEFTVMYKKSKKAVKRQIIQSINLRIYFRY
jgi:hypothetical protein